MIIRRVDRDYGRMSSSELSDSAGASSKLRHLQQAFKWVVYSLLFVNFVLYLIDDLSFAQHTLSESSGLVDRVSAFATTIAVAAWLTMLATLELETYALEDEQFTPWVLKALHGVRLVCVAMIAYSIFAFVDYAAELRETLSVDDAGSLCDMVERDVSFTYNIEYTEITSSNCRELSSDSTFFWVDGQEVVTDTHGLSLERWLAIADVAEIAIWLFIIAAMEGVVRLQDRGVASSRVMRLLTRIKLVGYCLLLALALWWATLSHWLYLWDTILWVGGFAAIELNLSQWRDEIREEAWQDVLDTR